MDLTSIKEIIDAESNAFQKEIQGVINQAITRRVNMKSQVVPILELDCDLTVTEEIFFNILDRFEYVSGNLDAVLIQAGFDSKLSAAWLRRENPPKQGLRYPILRMLIEVVFDYYANNRLYHDLHQVLEGWSDGKLPQERSIPLESTLEQLGMTKDISNLDNGVRIINCIRNDGIVTLGELLCRTESEMLRIPHFGRKSLTQLKTYLHDRFGAGFQDPVVPNTNLERFENMSRTRLSLEAHAGKPLVTQWHKGEKKPEYAALNQTAFQNLLNEKKAEEVYVQIYAAPDLLKALEAAGITHRTELATAPQHVIHKICHGKAGWKDQLEEILGFSVRYNWLKLTLGMSIPMFLDSKVKVYTP